MVVQEMLDVFTWVTDALDNVEENISSLDVTQYMEDARHGEESGAEAGEDEEQAAGEENAGVGQDEEAEEEPFGEGEQSGVESEEEIRATAAARRKAEELEVDLSSLKGTGLDRIIAVSDITGNGG